MLHVMRRCQKQYECMCMYMLCRREDCPVAVVMLYARSHFPSGVFAFSHASQTSISRSASLMQRRSAEQLTSSGKRGSRIAGRRRYGVAGGIGTMTCSERTIEHTNPSLCCLRSVSLLDLGRKARRPCTAGCGVNTTSPSWSSRNTLTSNQFQGSLPSEQDSMSELSWLPAYKCTSSQYIPKSK
jgi:hypothetical protein